MSIVYVGTELGAGGAASASGRGGSGLGSWRRGSLRLGGLLPLLSWRRTGCIEGARCLLVCRWG